MQYRVKKIKNTVGLTATKMFIVISSQFFVKASENKCKETKKRKKSQSLYVFCIWTQYYMLS